MALKAKSVSRDWHRVCRLYEASLQSAYNQTDPNIKIITVCHEKPDLEKSYDERVEFISVDFPPPARFEYQPCMDDKWAKLAIGMLRASQLNPDWIMIMDADDLVSNRLAAYAHAHPQANGWMVRTGYRWKHGRRWIELDHQFSCGTDSVVNAKLIRFPKNTSREETEQCMVLRWGHTIIGEKFAEAGTPLEPFPFPAAMYVHSHGDNASHFGDVTYWRGLKLLITTLPKRRWLGPGVRREFGTDHMLEA